MTHRRIAILVAVVVLVAIAFGAYYYYIRPAHSTKSDAALDSGADRTVYITRTGKCYHRASCDSLRHSKIPISLEKAQKRRFRACKLCGG